MPFPSNYEVFKPRPNAGLANLLCNWCEVVTAVVGVDTLAQLWCCQEVL